MKKEFKKHIDFKNLNYETVEVERLDDLVKEGVIPEDFTTKFPYLRERKPHSHHTAIMATYYGEGIECVQGAFFECLWYSYSINRKMDKTGRWRYFDLTNCMFGVKNKTFETRRSFTKKQVDDCFAYYSISFDTTKSSIGNFYYDDNGDLQTVDGDTPNLW